MCYKGPFAFSKPRLIQLFSLNRCLYPARCPSTVIVLGPIVINIRLLEQASVMLVKVLPDTVTYQAIESSIPSKRTRLSLTFPSTLLRYGCPSRAAEICQSRESGANLQSVPVLNPLSHSTVGRWMTYIRRSWLRTARCVRQQRALVDGRADYSQFLNSRVSKLSWE